MFCDFARRSHKTFLTSEIKSPAITQSHWSRAQMFKLIPRTPANHGKWIYLTWGGPQAVFRPKMDMFEVTYPLRILRSG